MNDLAERLEALKAQVAGARHDAEKRQTGARRFARRHLAVLATASAAGGLAAGLAFTAGGGESAERLPPSTIPSGSASPSSIPSSAPAPGSSSASGPTSAASPGSGTSLPAARTGAPAPAPTAEGRIFVPGGIINVQRGDSFWSIARLTEQMLLGRPPTDTQTASYWVDLVRANASRLVVVGNPNVIYPGQVLILPGL